MPQSPHRLRNDLKCVEWDVKPYTTNQPTSLSLLAKHTGHPHKATFSHTSQLVGDVPPHQVHRCHVDISISPTPVSSENGSLKARGTDGWIVFNLSKNAIMWFLMILMIMAIHWVTLWLLWWLCRVDDDDDDVECNTVHSIIIQNLGWLHIHYIISLFAIIIFRRFCTLYTSIITLSTAQFPPFDLFEISTNLRNTRSSATAKSTERPLCSVGVLYDIYRETNNRSTANQPLVRNWPWNLPNSAK